MPATVPQRSPRSGSRRSCSPRSNKMPIRGCSDYRGAVREQWGSRKFSCPRVDTAPSAVTDCSAGRRYSLPPGATIAPSGKLAPSKGSEVVAPLTVADGCITACHFVPRVGAITSSGPVGGRCNREIRVNEVDLRQILREELQRSLSAARLPPTPSTVFPAASCANGLNSLYPMPYGADVEGYADAVTTHQDKWVELKATSFNGEDVEEKSQAGMIRETPVLATPAGGLRAEVEHGDRRKNSSGWAGDSGILSACGVSSRKVRAEEKAVPVVLSWAPEKVSTFLQPWCDRLSNAREPERTGCLAELVNSRQFECTCIVVIVVNAFMTLLKTDSECNAAYTGESMPPLFGILNLGFVVFYTCELCLKLLVHRWYFFWSEEHTHWNCLDLFLVIVGLYDVVMSSLDTGKSINVVFLRTLRLMKMARVLRVFRLIRCMAVLRLIMNSLVGSIASLFWSIIMLLMIVFMFSLVFVQSNTNYMLEQGAALPEDQLDDLMQYFGSVSSSMLTLFMAIFGGDDWSVFYYLLSPMGTLVKACYLFFVAFTQIALVNILTGIFVENAMKLAEPDRSILFSEQQKSYYKNVVELERIVKTMDTDGDGLISEEEFFSALELRTGRLRTYLGSIGVHENDAKRFWYMLKAASLGEAGVEVDNFVGGCMRLAGGPQSIDVQAMAVELKHVHRKIFEMDRRSRDGMSSH